MMRLLDTNAVIYLQKGLLATTLPAGDYAISVITEMELLSFRGITDQEQIWLQKFLSQIHIMELDKDIKNLAIELRRDHQMKLPDAIIAATAICRQALLLTNDTGFNHLSDLQCQALLLKT